MQPSDIVSQYDSLEKKMLGDFYKFVKMHKEVRWIHWNMRDINYGFPAIAHRFKVLGGRSVEINVDKLFDLARMLQDIYGPNNVPHPRL